MDYKMIESDRSRPYTSRKMDRKNDSEMMNKINEYFDNPDNYLKIDENIIIGKKITGPKFDNNNKPIRYTYVGKPSLFEQPKPELDMTYRSRIKHTATKISLNNNRAKSPINYQIIDHQKVNKIFEAARNRVQSCKLPTPKNIDNLTREKFHQQEKLLNHQEHINRASTAMSKKIATKLKKNENELLMNKTDTFRRKRQIQEIIENEKPLVDKVGNIYWMVDLKRPKVAETIRTTYINPCPVVNPFKFDFIFDMPKKPVEIIHRVDGQKEDLKDFGKYMKNTLKDNKIDLEHYNQQSEMVVKGSSLLKEELKRATTGNGKRYMYNEIVNNNQEETFLKDYDERLYIKHKNFGIK
jgi:hypothetical protein